MDGRIDSLTNQKIKDTAALAMRRQRQKQGRFVAEGVRLGEMAAAADWPLCYALYTAELAVQSRGAALLEQLAAKDCPCYETSPTAFAKAAATQSPPGELIQTVISPLPEFSSSLKSCGVTSSSNQLSSAIVPFRYRVLCAGVVSVCA